MKGLIWIIILFAAAVGLAVASGIYTGNVYVVVGQTLLRVNLHAFVLGLLVLVVILYILVRIIAAFLNVPGSMQRFGSRRKALKAENDLHAAGLAYFEGKFQKAEQDAAKVLANKEAGSNRSLALMLAAHAADAMDDADLRNQYLTQIAKLPHKDQLSRYLLLAESALNSRDYAMAQENIQAAAQINPTLTRLVKLKLRYAFDHGDAAEVLEISAKLQKAGAINDHEAVQYQDWAYRRLLALASDAGSLKACLKRIPDALKADDLCVPIAEKYESLGLYGQAVAWVGKYYPQTRKAELLPPFVQSVQYLGEREQRKAIDTATQWLQQYPEDARLLMYVGQLAYNKALWGKAQGYLEASLAISPSIQAHLALAKVFDETGESRRAEEQRMLALEGVAQDEQDMLLPKEAEAVPQE
ncbi:MAG: heme biosynthesis HemY N-terminal domain-containing protein [Neisseria sp.]|uniref:heme biosynthesis HemY N-terminal domain-containing protein n=1 Tax=Neisseria sp. TaxID=192066 RepID=UPI0026DB7322|nr:heme biosynthesis HemY N-terminal domain-containing protein [Neisseria sp.]MDO4641144.1 heme biosynthesis HemY N-terminal domain-containing protein [Neisseria sp.]